MTRLVGRVRSEWCESNNEIRSTYGFMFIADALLEILSIFVFLYFFVIESIVLQKYVAAGIIPSDDNTSHQQTANSSTNVAAASGAPKRATQAREDTPRKKKLKKKLKVSRVNCSRLRKKLANIPAANKHHDPKLAALNELRSTLSVSLISFCLLGELNMHYFNVLSVIKCNIFCHKLQFCCLL